MGKFIAGIDLSLMTRFIVLFLINCKVNHNNNFLLGHTRNRMENLTFAGFVVLILSIPVVAFNRGSEEERGILNPMPEVINVMAHTNAWINWTHSLPPTATLVWYSLDEDGNRVKLMYYVDNKLHIERKHQSIGRRIGHRQYPGSASLYLNNVTSADAGKYELRLSPQGEPGAYESSVVTLCVFNGSDIQFSVAFDGVVFDLTVQNNGTDIDLPVSRVMLKPTPRIAVKISDVIPAPTSIEHIFKNVDYGYNVPYEKVLQHHVQHSDIHLNWSVEVTVEVRFDIQNLNLIRISKLMYSQGSWIKRPGNIMVLAHTTAHFDWTHSILGDLNIAWYYKGTESAPEVSHILGFGENQVYIPVNGNHYTRLAFNPFPGSATMQLSNVNKQDEGIYEVKVADVNSDTMYSISDTTELDVVEASDLKLNILVERESFSLSVKDNGTDVPLPDVHTAIPARHRIGLTISDTAPEATIIKVMHLVGGIAYTEIPCEHTRVCEKHIHFGLELQPYLTTTIRITLGFDIQNLGIVSYHYRVIHSAHQALEHDVMNTDSTAKSSDDASSSSRTITSCGRSAFLVIGCFVALALRL